MKSKAPPPVPKHPFDLKSQGTGSSRVLGCAWQSSAGERPAAFRDGWKSCGRIPNRAPGVDGAGGMQGPSPAVPH